jgi:hypothetical protein
MKTPQRVGRVGLRSPEFYVRRRVIRPQRPEIDVRTVAGTARFSQSLRKSSPTPIVEHLSIAPIVKRVAQWIGIPARFVAEVSGHSTRVGAPQDLAELDIDLAAITQAGGWKSARMPLQYVEKINAARSGMARAAAASGRDESVSN